MSIEAMKQALEALENPWSAGPQGVANAITAIRTALEQAEKPVATVKLKIENRFIRGSDMGLGCSDGYVTNRYLTLEFINYNMNDPEKSCFKDGDVLYTNPPAEPRQWVGLTRNEAMEIIKSLVAQDWMYAVDAIEEKLKEKNHG
jgi:hypothetical protein